MEEKLRILILEDVPADAELMERELRKGGIIFSSKKVDTKKAFLKELKEFAPDLILGDYSLPSFDGLTALEIVREKCPDIPFIFVSGSIGEELAIETLKRGATDYVLKDRLSRLVPGVNRALREVKERADRKQAEVELEKERDRAQRYLDIAGVMLVVINTDQEVVLINRKGCEILGYKEEEIIGRNWFDHFIPERDRKSVKAVFAELVAAEIEPVEHFENTVLTKSGMEKIIVWHNTIITDENGHIMGTLSSGEDITERKRAEKTLQESENRYRQVVEDATEIIYTVDEKGNFTYANRAGLKVIGYSIGELRKFNYADLVVPGHRERVSQVYFNQFRDRLPTTYVEFPFFSKGEEIIWFGQNSTLVMDGDKIVGFHIIARDITKRKRAEEALRESEQRYRNLVENAPDVIYTLAPDGTITSLNPAFERITGWPQSHWLGKPFTSILHPDDLSRGLEFFQRILKREKIAPFELRVLAKSGDCLVAEFTVTTQTQDGVVIGLLGIARDVTEHKRAEEALRESEKRYRTLAEAAPDMIFIVDGKGYIKYVNSFAAKQFRNRPEEIIGKSLKDLFPHEMSDRQRGNLQTVFETLKPIYHESMMTLLDRDVWLSTWLAPLVNEAGEVYSVLGISRDITKHKQAEEALRKGEEVFRELYDNAPVGYFEYDAQGCILSVNRTELEMLGYTLEEMIGQPVWKFIVEEDIARNLILGKLAGTVPPSRDLERTYRRKDGTTFPALVQDRLLRDADGSIKGLRATVQDITERKQIEQEKANLEEQLRQSQKIEAIGRLAGGIAHDFNNLLTVIKGYSQLSLVETEDGSPLKENLEEITKAAERAADLTRQLLAFSRRQILEMKVLDLNSLLMDLDKMLHRLIGEDIELITLLADDLGRVKTDPGWVEQIIMNLAVNARDAMPKGGKLTVETANVELDEAYARGHIAVKPGRYVMLSVSDTGVGMTPEVRQQVFEPFFTTKEKSKGTGLGLSTVYGIVKQSGGNIWVYSEPGQGTTFKIYLPRVDEPLEELRERVVKEELPQGKETVLVVEDEQAVRQLAVRILKRQGYKVLEAPQGVDALLLCEERKEPIHLILTDVIMPGMSGRQLVDRCWQIRQDFKALYMSGYTDNAIVQHGVLVEGINYIQKPFTVEALARKVREVLDQ
jgi:PAS domain S-box-containing protein